MGDNEVNLCIDCKGVVDKTSGLTCGVCDKYLHLSCIGASAEEATTLLHLCNRSRFIKIYCSFCLASVTSNISEVSANVLKCLVFKDGVSDILGGVLYLWSSP